MYKSQTETKRAYSIYIFNNLTFSNIRKGIATLKGFADRFQTLQT